MSEPPLCTYKELLDGTYSFNDFIDMHEALDLSAAYQYRAQQKHE